MFITYTTEEEGATLVFNPEEAAQMIKLLVDGLQEYIAEQEKDLIGEHACYSGVCTPVDFLAEFDLLEAPPRREVALALLVRPDV